VRTQPLIRGAVLTVVLATAACGGQGDGPVAAPSSSATGSSSSTASPSAAVPGGSASGAASGTGSGSASGSASGSGSGSAPGSASESAGGEASGSTPTVTAPNTSQLRKNATKPQRKFIARNAPPGVDAEAILQAGEEACHRMTIAQRSAGRISVAVALVSGQIANGREAIAYLCPELKPALQLAEDGFPDGNYVVGTQPRKNREVVAGRYEAPQASDECVWSVTKADGSVVSEGRGTAQAKATLSRGLRFTSSGCFAWLRS
jgi:hypothetical protein